MECCLNTYLEKRESDLYFSLHSDIPSSLLTLSFLVFYDLFCKDALYPTCAPHFTKNALIWSLSNRKGDEHSRTSVGLTKNYWPNCPQPSLLELS